MQIHLESKLIDFFSESFTKFRSTLDRFQLGISLPNFLKVLSPLRDNDMVVFCLENEDDEVIKVQGFYTYKRSNEFLFVKIRIEESNQQTVGLGIGLDSPDFFKIEMSSTQFADLFKHYKDLSGKNVNLTYTTDGKFIVSLPEDAGLQVSGSTALCEGESMTMSVKPRGADWSKIVISELTRKSCNFHIVLLFFQKNISESSVNADYIAKFGPLGAQINARVTLYMKPGYPFICEYKDGLGTIKCTFYLVPRVVQ